jgi:hypothetical protein
MFVFCDKCCVRSDKCVSIIIKIKYVNFDNISDICDKFYFTTIYKYFIITDTQYIKKHTHIIISRDLSISDGGYMRGVGRMMD